MFTTGITFEWDGDKAAANEAKHKLTFEIAAEVFYDPGFVVVSTARAQDGEDREKATGLIDGRLFTVVFHRRGSVIRIISARRANAKEERTYGHR